MHNESNADTIPLAAHRKALREAERAALTKLADKYWNDASPCAYATADAAQEFRDREFPEPEPELRWITIGGHGEYRPRLAARRADGAWRLKNTEDGDEYGSDMNDADVRRLASLLPREPVAVTEEVIQKAKAAYFDRPGGPDSFDDGMHRALLAVASDLSAPVAVAAPTLGEPDNKPEAYVAMGKNNTSPYFCTLLSDARRSASVRNSEPSWHHPFCVYALHRVPDETEGAANG